MIVAFMKTQTENVLNQFYLEVIPYPLCNVEWNWCDYERWQT